MRKIAILLLSGAIIAASAAEALARPPYWGPRLPYHRYGPPPPPPPPPSFHRHRRHRDAAALGAMGIAIGAIAAGAIASQARAAPPPPATVDPRLAAYCARKYKSFDPVTGTYVTYSGRRVVCTW